MIVKIYGAAGCGKTTELERRLDDLIEQGVGYQHILYTGSVNATIDEMKSRREQKGVASRDLRFFNTIHGICYRLLGWAKPVCNTKEKQEFCDDIGLEYKPYERGYEATLLEGNNFFAKYDLAIATKVDRDNLPNFFESSNVNGKIYLEYEKFKEKNELWDYGDMLRVAYEKELKPNQFYQFYDEFQDMSPLQYDLYRLWSMDAREANDERVWIAGDPNQSLYSFQGGSPDFFINEQAKEVFLQKGYRVPSNIWRTAIQRLEVSKAEKDRLLSIQTPIGGEMGSCSFVEAANKALAVKEGCKVFFLHRTNEQAKDTRNALKDAGLWTWERFEAYSVVESLRKFMYAPSTFNEGDLKLVGKFLPEEQIRKDKTPVECLSLPRFSEDGMVESFISEMKGDWHTTSEIKSYIRWHNYSLRGIPRNFHIHIGTVHSKKGGEADLVFAMLENNRKDADFEEEGRVAYVALTRAKTAFFELY